MNKRERHEFGMEKEFKLEHGFEREEREVDDDK